MGKDAARLLVVAVASVALILASLFGVDWFVAHIEGMEMMGVGSTSIDLRSVHVCTNIQNVCASVPLNTLHGIYPTSAAITFWSSLGFAALVGLQAGRRIVIGAAGDSASKFGYLYALYGLAIAFATGYLFAPESTAMGDMSISVDRTWSPAMLLGGFALGFVALHLAIAESDDVGDFKPTLIAHGHAGGASAATPAPPTAVALSGKREIPDSVPLDAAPPRRAVPDSLALDFGPSGGDVDVIARDPSPRGAAPPHEPREPETISIDGGAVAVRLKRPAAQPLPPASAPVSSELPAFELPSVDTPASGLALDLPGDLPNVQDVKWPSAPFAGDRAKRPTGGPVSANIAYAVSTAQLSPSKIETERHDGEPKRVLWRDVVGVVVRRLPASAPYDGGTFVDIVSTAGSTLRILPGTTVRGETLPDRPDDRARALVRIAIKYKPDVHLDLATREFLKGREPAAQLPDAATLAKHDARLA